MPIKRCSEKGMAGYKWGSQGKCYGGSGGRARAGKQAAAAYAHGYRGAGHKSK